MASENKDLRYKILASVVGTDAITRFNNELKSTADASKKVTTDFDKLMAGAKKLAGLWVTNEVIQYGKHLIDTGNKIGDVSQKTGVAVRDLSELSSAAEMGGIGLETLAANLNKLNGNILLAANGTKEYKDVFNALQIEVKDGKGNLKSASDVFKEVADRFVRMEDGAGKAAAATKLFGKSGYELIPLLNKGSEGIEKFSIAIDERFASGASKFNDTLAEIKQGATNFALTGMNELLPSLQDIAENFYLGSENSEAFNTSMALVGETARLTVASINMLTVGVMNTADIVGTAFVSAAYLVSDAWNGTATVVGDSIQGLWKAATGDISGAKDIFSQLAEKSKNGVRASLAEQEELGKNFLERFEKRGEEAGEKISKLMSKSIFFGNGGQDPGNDLLKKQAKDLNYFGKEVSKERDRVKEFIEQQKLENDQRRKSLSDINLNALELTRVTEIRKLEAEAIRYSKTMTAEQRAELMKALEVLKMQREALVEQEFLMKRTWSYGARDYLREYLDNVDNAAKQTKDVFNTAFNSLEDTMVKFVKTGKLNFRDFADSVISELIRIAVRQAILAPIAGAMSGALSNSFSTATTSMNEAGSVISPKLNPYYANYSMSENGNIVTPLGPLPLKKYANGGIARSPHVAIFGEGRTPEAYVPLPDGRTIPVTMNGGSGGVNLSMNINIDNSGKSEESNSKGAEQGKELGLMIKGAVMAVITEQKRPGGILYGGS